MLYKTLGDVYVSDSPEKLGLVKAGCKRRETQLRDRKEEMDQLLYPMCKY